MFVFAKHFCGHTNIINGVYVIVVDRSADVLNRGEIVIRYGDVKQGGALL